MSMFSKLKQIKDLRSQAKRIQDVLKDITVEGTAAWGMIKVKMNGSQEVQAVSIDQDLMSDRSKVESGVKEAFNDAVKKAQKEMAETMRKSGDLKIPGLS